MSRQWWNVAGGLVAAVSIAPVGPAEARPPTPGKEARQDVEGTVRAIVAKQLKLRLDQITLESRFGVDLRSDSLDAVEILLACEETFRIEIPDAEIEGIKRVRDLVDTVRRHLKKAR
jgi:acyl carrier protein